MELFSKQKLTLKYNNNTYTKKKVGSDFTSKNIHLVKIYAKNCVMSDRKYVKENKQLVSHCREYLVVIVSGGVTAVAAANQRR